MKASRYTVYGSKELDGMIDKHMKLISDSMMSKLNKDEISAIILGGGYGRGEGGFIKSGDTEKLYNDFDMFIIAKNISRKRKKELTPVIRNISEKLSHQIGIDVDFSPIQNESVLPKAPFWMMWYDLKMGHKVIYGDPGILNSLPDWKPENMPLNEGLRLMLNRGAGLFFAGEKLNDAELDQKALRNIEKDISKAYMACGDLFLIANSSFSHSYVKKISMLEKFKNSTLIAENNFYSSYEDSINYKLRPYRKNIDKNSISESYNKIISVYKKFWLYGFGRLFGKELADFNDFYSYFPLHRFREINDNPVYKNIILNIKEVGLKNIDFKLFFSNPRYRLYSALPYLLFDKKDNVQICKILGLKNGSDRDKISNTFIKLWSRFN